MYLFDFHEPDVDDLDEELDAEEIRERLRDYYGTAMFSGFPMTMMDLGDVDSMDEDELLEEAARNGLL